MGALNQIERIESFETPDSKSERLAREVLSEVLRFRRADLDDSCRSVNCKACMNPHLQKVMSAIIKNQPIEFALPAFPGKSPNPEKVLGPLPDMAERYSLKFLNDLCESIKRLYAPGARIILCSDGRVFSDAVGMHEEDVTNYQLEISKIIGEENLTCLSTFNLDDMFQKADFETMRSHLMGTYGESQEALRASILRGSNKMCGSDEDSETHRLYCGITRFLVEDSNFPGQQKSRTAVQKECKIRALEVIRRSRAWAELIVEKFPSAVRLSIHPQSCGSKKLGIRLMEPDNWMTPWHGVATQLNGHFILLKNAKAKSLGAKLEFRNGRPSHYVLENEQGVFHAI